MSEKEIRKEEIYTGLDSILINLEKLKKKTNKEKVAYLLHIQTILTKLLYNALKDIDDINENVLNIIKAMRKQITNEDIEYGDLEEEVPMNENDLKRTESKLGKKTYDIGNFYS